VDIGDVRAGALLLAPGEDKSLVSGGQPVSY
jgi:hypothetical protein